MTTDDLGYAPPASPDGAGTPADVPHATMPDA